MRVPVSLVDAFGAEFEQLISQFAVDEGMMPTADSISSDRFLSRSVVPHIEKMSKMFNRIEDKEAKTNPSEGLAPYWKDSSNPQNLRLAYFLYFMPSNLFRTASVLAELGSLGYRWPHQKSFKGIEWGAGPASGACGVAAGFKFGRIGDLPSGDFALIEQDKAVLGLGEAWAKRYFESLSLDWGIRPFHRKVDWTQPLLPRSAPQFQLWLSSFFLNEAEIPISKVADRLTENWERHLENEGLVILVEPALKIQSRRLLELRRELIGRFEGGKLKSKYQVLLPCLGHQACGALSATDDWCHEEAKWWRPPYFRKIDDMAKLDRKSLPFSYLVISKSARPMGEILPALGTSKKGHHRLVSPVHYEGKDSEFFICGPDGKSRARFRTEHELGRGDILVDAEIRGDAMAKKVDSVKKILGP